MFYKLLLGSFVAASQVNAIKLQTNTQEATMLAQASARARVS